MNQNDRKSKNNFIFLWRGFVVLFKVVLVKFWIHATFQTKWAVWYQWPSLYLYLLLEADTGACLYSRNVLSNWNWKCTARPDHGSSPPCILFSLSPTSHSKWERNDTYLFMDGATVTENTVSFTTSLWAKKRLLFQLLLFLRYAKHILSSVHFYLAFPFSGRFSPRIWLFCSLSSGLCSNVTFLNPLM